MKRFSRTLIDHMNIVERHKQDLVDRLVYWDIRKKSLEAPTKAQLTRSGQNRLKNLTLVNMHIKNIVTELEPFKDIIGLEMPNLKKYFE